MAKKGQCPVGFLWHAQSRFGGLLLRTGLGLVATTFLLALGSHLVNLPRAPALSLGLGISLWVLGRGFEAARLR